MQGTRKIEQVLEESKPRPERKHVDEQPSASYEDLEIGKRTFMDVHNRKTVNEYSQEGVMGSKKRVQTMYEQRNGMPAKSLGDKIYKVPEYQSNFFKEGGLVTGST